MSFLMVIDCKIMRRESQVEACEVVRDRTLNTTQGKKLSEQGPMILNRSSLRDERFWAL